MHINRLITISSIHINATKSFHRSNQHIIFYAFIFFRWPFELEFTLADKFSGNIYTFFGLIITRITILTFVVINALPISVNKNNVWNLKIGYLNPNVHVKHVPVYWGKNNFKNFTNRTSLRHNITRRKVIVIWYLYLLLHLKMWRGKKKFSSPDNRLNARYFERINAISPVYFIFSGGYRKARKSSSLFFSPSSYVFVFMYKVHLQKLKESFMAVYRILLSMLFLCVLNSFQ